MIRAALLATLLAGPAAAQMCQDITYGGEPYTICETTADAQIDLFLTDPETGAPFGQFQRIDKALQDGGKRLAFAMNAGMYHGDRSPVGLYVENKVITRDIVPNAGPGNFGLLPNGVFCIGDGFLYALETFKFLETQPDCIHATQSGPMLVIDGALHPRFLPDSTSRYVRNGVGTTADGTRAVFAISNRPVTFHDFGTLFRDHLKLPNALYFDGNVSRLYAPDMGRADAGFPLGPIVGVVVDAP